MKSQLVCVSFGLVTAFVTSCAADKPTPPPPVSLAPGSGTVPAPAQVYVYDQKPVNGRPVLIKPEQAQAIIEKFKASYGRLGSPRLLIYVNRDLIDETSGLKLTDRTQKTQATRTTVNSDFKADPNAHPSSNGVTFSGQSVTVTGSVGAGANLPAGTGTISTTTEKESNQNSFKNGDRPALGLADRQTIRDVERLFGRPLRMAGSSLVDQRTATQLLQDHPIAELKTTGGSDAARKDREAVGKVADVVIEILIAAKNIAAEEVSGPVTYTVPDIHATAIRISDSRILGQASSSDIIGKERYASYIARNFDVREITEATALALMEDLSQ